MLKVGDKVKVLKGRANSIVKKNDTLTVQEISAVGRVTLKHRTGKTFSMWTSALGKLAHSEFNLNTGDPTQYIRLTRVSN